MISSRAWMAMIAGSGAVLSTALFSLHARVTVGEPLAIQGVLEPVTMEAGSSLGGTVAEICVRPGEQVHKGEVLVRFDTSQLRTRRQRLIAALRATERALQGREVIERIPDSLRGY